LFPELVFETQAMEIAQEFIEMSDKRCSHCHRKIYGKVYQSGTNYYDSYCWQFRFINLSPVDEADQQRAHDLHTFLESKGAR
jgi:hypothetical protein